MKYLGVFLGDEAAVKKNWEGVVENVRQVVKVEVAAATDVL